MTPADTCLPYTGDANSHWRSQWRCLGGQDPSRIIGAPPGIFGDFKADNVDVGLRLSANRQGCNFKNLNLSRHETVLNSYNSAISPKFFKILAPIGRKHFYKSITIESIIDFQI